MSVERARRLIHETISTRATRSKNSEVTVEESSTIGQNAPSYVDSELILGNLLRQRWPLRKGRLLRRVEYVMVFHSR